MARVSGVEDDPRTTATKRYACGRTPSTCTPAGSQSNNLRYAVALGRHRGPHPGNIDPRGRDNRALAIRAALAGGYDPLRLATARDPNPALGLFDLDPPNVSGSAATTGTLTA